VPVTAIADRVPQRRRGAALEDAIVEAAYDELSVVGYSSFTVEGVAARAKTGKASIYRRWPTKQLLLLDALLLQLPTPADCGIVPDIPDDVTTADALRNVARAMAGVMTSPAGVAMRAIKCEALVDPDLARVIDERFQAPRREALLSLLARGVARGEVRPDAVTTLIADVLPAVVTHRIVFQGETLTDQILMDIMDQVMVPLIAPR
jgi:AcrR family transcriptional regulator